MLTPEQIRAGRAILRITQSELAEISGVSEATIKKLELDSDAINSSSNKILSKIENVFIKNNIQFETNEDWIRITLKRK